MKPQDFRKLQRGDIVRGKSSGLSYVVTANYGGRVTAVTTVDLTNPDEWDVVAKAHQQEIPIAGEEVIDEGKTSAFGDIRMYG